MNRQGKLVAVKKGIYLKVDVEKRKLEQNDLRKKYYKRWDYFIYFVIDRIKAKKYNIVWYN